MAAINVTGKVVKCETRRMTDPDYNYAGRYSPNTERYLIRLNICLLTDKGERFFFDSPAYRMNVANCPGAAVVTYYPEGKDAGNWFSETGGCGVATSEKSNENGIIPLVKEGDTLTVRGSVKAVKPTYTSLNRIKMVK